MKRIYVKPETETVLLSASVILTSSVETIWDTQYGETGKKDDVENGDNPPDPSTGAGSKAFNLWDDWE